MYFIRHAMTRAAGARQGTSAVAQLKASRNAHRRNYASSPNELADSRGTPLWIYGLVAGGAGGVLYLWRKGNQNAKAAATQKIPEHRGANSEYVKKSEGN